MKKRGSLELSINAIVVLVLAITMLGLGIAFTKGKFSEIGSKIEIPEPDLPATADDPIMTPSKEITVSTKKDTVFGINVYNDGNLATTSPGTTPLVDCQCAGSASNTYTPSLFGQVIPSGEDRLFKVSVPKDDLVGAGVSAGDNCLCTITVSDATPQVVASKQISFKVM